MDTVELSKWDVFRQCNWRAHKAQRAVLAAPNRMKAVSAGRRFGKSEIGGHDLVVEALATAPMEHYLKEQGYRREFWIVGPEYTDSEKEFRILWNTLTRLGVPFDKPGSYNDPIGGSLHMSLWRGSFIVHGKSAKHPETLVGEGLHGVVCAEAAKLKYRVWTKFVRPMLADYNGWASLVSTPEGKNWFYNMFGLGQDPNVEEWFSMRAPSWRNPYVYRSFTDDADVAYLQDMMEKTRTAPNVLARELGINVDAEVVSLLNDMTPESFNQEIGADFTEYVGRVFKDFDEEVHVTDLQFNPNWKTFACTDYGFTNPNVWLLLQVGPWNEIHVLAEVYKRGLTADEFAMEIVRANLVPFGLITFYPDPEDPGATKTLENILRVRHSGGTGGRRDDRIDSIREALRVTNMHLDPDHPLRKPTIRFDRKCVYTIHDMLEYRYPDTKEEMGNAKEEPMKKDDHGPEALGRFFAGYFGTPSAQKGGTKVHQAKFGVHHDNADDYTINTDGTLKRRFSRTPDNNPGRLQKATREQLAATNKRNWK
jgi:hypothetical protein